VSNKNNLSDYHKVRTDLNKLLPANNLQDASLLEGLNENLFNRFLTKSEIQRIIGYIGSDPQNISKLNQILEPTPYRQGNQLQPIVHNKVGDVDWFMSFQDFINRIGRLGVNTDRFNEWGNSLQFNWVPPIDLDKLINYGDYFWDSGDFSDPPQYITVKNQSTWSTSRLNNTLNSVTSGLNAYQILVYDAGANSITLAGDVTSDFRATAPTVLSGSSVDPILVSPTSVTYSTITEETTIVFNVSEYNIVLGTSDIYSIIASTELTVVAAYPTARAIDVRGDVTSIFSHEFIFSSEDDTVTPSPITLWKVESSEYNTGTDNTRITVTDDFAVFEWTRVTVKPIIRSVQAETNVMSDTNYTRSKFLIFNETHMGEVIWVKNIALYNGTTGAAEGTSLGSKLFTDTAGSVNYVDGNYKLSDKIRITGTGFDGDYSITNLVTSDVVQLDSDFFTQNQIAYSLIRPRLLSDIESDTSFTAKDLREYWFDTVNNQLRQWDGAIWDVKVQNFSYLADNTHNTHLVDLTQRNDWVDQNKWVHRNDINTFTGKSRAQNPIIEYFPYVELSKHSFADKSWKYRDSDLFSYTPTTVEPSLFELIDTRITSGGGELSFEALNILVFDSKFGNLTPSLVAGDEIQLVDFGINTGDYTVASSEYVQPTPTSRFITKVYLAGNVNSVAIVPIGGHVAPKYTAVGDQWISFETEHWQFEGIEDISASSISPTKNPMLDGVIDTWTDGTFQTKLGLMFQEFKLLTGSQTGGVVITFDESLHDLCLFEDFQEGDLRVYINGVRQYGNFIDIAAPAATNFVGSIIFDDSITITSDDVVRAELGEYALDEIGKRAVYVNTPNGPELFNLVDIRYIEQTKDDRSQYPWFSIYNVNNEPLRKASNLFKFTNSVTGEYLPNIDQRVDYDAATQNYTFSQDLIGSETGELYLYYDRGEFGEEYQSIWKKGLYNEQYVPRLEDGLWEIPNQLFFNPKHDNRETIKLTEIFRHFTTITNSQYAQGISGGVSNMYRLTGIPNYGLGGRIKEHNDGFDTLLSAMFVNNINPIDLIYFARQRYASLQANLFEILEENIVTYLSQGGATNYIDLVSYINEEVKDNFEKNDRLDQWFGDSTTYNEDTNEGVKNWIATAPFFGLAPKVQPYIINDNIRGLRQVVHHDGHRKTIVSNPAIVSAIFSRILASADTNSETQTVASEGDAFPTTINGNAVATGDFVVRSNTTTKTRKLYMYSNIAVWEEVDVYDMYAEVILNIETALYSVLDDSLLPNNFVSKFDFDIVKNDEEYAAKIQEQFSVYLLQNHIQIPYLNTTYVQNDTFTWNYAYTGISTGPITGSPTTNTYASWQALYENLYGTPYPHLEPWVLQGYTSKPSWWDAEYLDVSLTRTWLAVMWANILDGTIPSGNPAPNGLFGTGVAGQITQLFTYLPVNIEATNTLDGYTPDGILPPYWNSNNSANVAVRTPYDAKLQEFIVTPNAGFSFGQLGPDEWKWSVSNNKIYDDMIVAFKIQPLRFMNQSFGKDLIDVAALQLDDTTNKVSSHDNILFHGEVYNTNQTFKSNGINQWYVHFNRYSGFDGVSSEFRQMWTGWEAPLTYQFGAFIDTQNFKIGSDLFDVTTKDYGVLFKKASGIRDMWLDALVATSVSSPSRYATEFEAGLDWTVEFSNTSPIGKPIEAHGVQNYPVSIESGSNILRTFSFTIDSAEISDSFGFDVVQYSESLVGATATELANDATVYTATVTFDGVDVVNLSVTGSAAQTFSELLAVINIQLGVYGTAYLSGGNLTIASDTIGGLTFSTIVDVDLFSTASSNFLGTTGNSFNPTTFDKVLYVSDDLSKYFSAGSTFDIVNSTNLNGTYTVSASAYNASTKLTRIEIDGGIIIGNTIIDGSIEPTAAVDLPEQWTTGVGLNWTSNGMISAPFNTTSLYYLIRDNGREFRLSTTREGAVAGTDIITPTTVPLNQNYIGRIQNTFTAFGARKVLAYWKQHYVDDRVVYSYPTPTTISGIQNMIDFINGYRSYLESIGFVYDDTDGTNRDVSTGRAYTWQLETEELIEFLYNSRTINEENSEQYSVTPNAPSNAFTSEYAITWNTGTKVTLSSVGGTLPAELENPIVSTVPYYIIQGVGIGTFQLAGSQTDARNGKPIKFSDNGTGVTVVTLAKSNKALPSIELNPHKQSVMVDTDTGIISNMVAGNNLDVITNQRVYGSDNIAISNSDLIVSRRDLRTRIHLTGDRVTKNITGSAPIVNIAGMHVFVDGYEHVLQFENVSSGGILIYDSFLGINTLRFTLEFDRQDGFTLRPNVGGDVILGESQVQNMESAIESLRYAYSAYGSREGDDITKSVRAALGYAGPYDYGDDIGLTDKSQFTFYRGLIQKKGTNFAANAFANQKQYSNLDIDEFWAYKLGTYGDSKLKTYPELKLFSREVSRKELRLDFIEPLGTSDNSDLFNATAAIDLTDSTRWFEQPDQLEKMHPRNRFYLNARVAERLEGVSADLINGNYYIQLTEPADGAIITHQVSAGPPTVRVELVAGVGYQFITNKLIKFITDPTTLTSINVSTLTYSYDAESPAKIINRKAKYVVSEVPIWNPARQQYYSTAIYGVDYRSSTDPANYTTNLWDSRFNDKVWFDITYEYYLPFDDIFIQPDVNARMSNWGKLSPYGKIQTYQWVESDVIPTEYDRFAQLEGQSGATAIDDRKTGTSRKLLYVNTSTYPIQTWEEILTGATNTRDQIVPFIAELVTTSSFTAAGLPTTKDVSVYVDSVFYSTGTFNNTTFAAFAVFVAGTSAKTIHVVNLAVEPTPTQITAFEYKYDSPYVTVNKVDPITGNNVPNYYFWVSGRLATIPVLGGTSSKTTLFTINKGLGNIPTPYMIPDKLTDISASISSDVLNLSYEFPYAYTRLVVKGIGGTVPTEDTYTLRFTKDFSLRDRLDSPNISELNRKNVHTEWKMFRERQFDKIDVTLWNAVVESILGFEYDGGALVDVVPDVSSPVLTPTPTIDVSPSATSAVDVTPTPTLTPNVTPTPTLTPNATPGSSSASTPLPSATPANTPVVSSTPEPTPTPTSGT
jgi:hypothetical protein